MSDQPTKGNTVAHVEPSDTIIHHHTPSYTHQKFHSMHVAPAFLIKSFSY